MPPAQNYTNYQETSSGTGVIGRVSSSVGGDTGEAGSRLTEGDGAGITVLVLLGDTSLAVTVVASRLAGDADSGSEKDFDGS